MLKYFAIFMTGGGGSVAEDGFSGYISSDIAPVVFRIVYLGLTVAVVIAGVNKGIERFSKVLMPILFFLIIGISIFCLTLDYTDASGTTRTGLEGLKIYIIPDFSDITFNKIFTVFIDALGQLLFDQCCHGIMVAYGSYVKRM